MTTNTDETAVSKEAQPSEIKRTGSDSQVKLDLEAEADTSAAIIGLVTFVGDSSRGIIFPVLWPLCQSLGGNRIEYSFLVAIFSVGRLLVTKRLGIISDQYRHRFTLTLAGSVFVIGALLWANTQFIGPLAVLFIAQFVLGLGTGTLGVTRSYVAEQVAPAKRTYMLARLSALQYAGFAATPLLGSALVVAGSSISTTMEFVFPGYLVVILSMICLFLLIFKFKDFADLYEHAVENEKDHKNSIELTTVVESSNNPLTDLDKNNSSTSTSPGSSQDDDEAAFSTDGSTKSQQSVDLASVEDVEAPRLSVFEMPQIGRNKAIRNRVFLLMLFLNFATRGGIAVFETQGAEIMLDQYNMPQWEVGLLVSIAGAIGTVQLIYFKQFWCKNFTDIQLMLGALVLFAVAQLLVINWGPARDTPPWQYVLAMYLVYAFAYPISNSAVLGTFSSIQKAGKQAKAQGQFAFMGSLSRVVLPIATGYLETAEYSSSFALVLIIMCICIAGVVFLHHEIVFFSSPILASHALFDSHAAHHQVSFASKFVMGACVVTALVALMTMFNWGVPSWSG